MREQQLAAGWARELARVAARIGTFVTHPAPRARVGRFLDGTLAGTGRRNGWPLAEAAHEATPYGMQRLVASAAWDVEGVRDDLRAYVRETLGDRAGVLIVDETGFLKKGDQVRRGATPIQRHRRPHRELPTRGLPGVRHRARPCLRGPRVVRARVVDRGSRAVPGSERSRRPCASGRNRSWRRRC